LIILVIIILLFVITLLLYLFILFITFIFPQVKYSSVSLFTYTICFNTIINNMGVFYLKMKIRAAIANR